MISVADGYVRYPGNRQKVRVVPRIGMKSYRLTAFATPLQLDITEIPIPVGGEVILRVLAAGVCHTDLHLKHGSYDLGRGQKLSVADRGVKLPLTMGHETVGTVVALGPEAEQGIRIGENYLIYPWLGCGTCETCVAGDEHFCAAPRTLGIYRDGGYSEYIRVPHGRCLLPLHGLDPVSAAPLACSGLTNLQCLEEGRSAHPA